VAGEILGDQRSRGVRGIEVRHESANSRSCREASRLLEPARAVAPGTFEEDGTAGGDSNESAKLRPGVRGAARSRRNRPGQGTNLTSSFPEACWRPEGAAGDGIRSTRGDEARSLGPRAGLEAGASWDRVTLITRYRRHSNRERDQPGGGPRGPTGRAGPSVVEAEWIYVLEEAAYGLNYEVPSIEHLAD